MDRYPDLDVSFVDSDMNKKDSSAGIAAGIVDDAENLVKLEVQLAKQELIELAITNAYAIGAFAGAALLAIIALLIGIPVLIVVLVDAQWAAALVWIIIYLAIAGGLALYGRTKLRIEAPQLTINTLKETRNWALRQIKSPGR
jgi:uncharacterized membrane protein YqjE